MTLRTTRRRWLATAAAFGCGTPWSGTGAAGAASSPGKPFPTRPITLWVPWAAGGATDLLLRLLAELAGSHLGQRVVIENRGGAGGTLAMPILQNAAPDGYTIAQIPQPVLRAPFVHKVLWHPVRDITPIIQISGVTFGVLVAAASPLRTLADLLAFAQSRPGELTIATNGVGTTPHLVLEEIFTQRGLRYVHVPYKGSSQLLLALEGDQVMAGVSATGFAPAVDDGRLRLLATLAGTRSARWPQVPTLEELGFPIVAMSPWGLGGPRGMAPAVVNVLHDAFRKAMLDPAFVQELAKFDQLPDYRDADGYGRWLREQYAKERVAAERMNITRDGN